MTAPEIDIRPSPLAGTWYPAEPDELGRLVDDYLAAATPEEPAGRIIGLLVPHAGLRYSGPVAAYGFKLLQDMAPAVVAILCPYHRPPYSVLDSPFVTTAHAVYETPLGTVPVDRDSIAMLGSRVPLTEIRHDNEHALEIELPFLQRVLAPGFRLLPVMMIDQTQTMVERLGHALAAILAGSNALLIASTDLSHFFPQQIALQLDDAVLDAVRTRDPVRVLHTGERPGEGACGRGALAAVMWAARDLGADTAAVLHHATSGDTSGDYSQVVGYAAGVFYASKTQPE